MLLLMWIGGVSSLLLSLRSSSPVALHPPRLELIVVDCEELHQVLPPVVYVHVSTYECCEVPAGVANRCKLRRGARDGRYEW